MPLSTSRVRKSPDKAHGFFRLCGSPIRTHTQSMEYDSFAADTRRKTAPQCAHTFVRPAELVDQSLPPLPMKTKATKLRQEEEEEEARACQVDGEGHAYYYDNSRCTVPSSSVPIDAQDWLSYMTVENWEDSRGLGSAQRAGVPLCLSDWFDPIKYEADRCRQTNAPVSSTMQEEPESECTVCSLMDDQQHYIDDDDEEEEEEDGKARDATEYQFLEPQQNVDMADVTIGRVIGEGAFGKVFQASWKGRDVAVKVLVRQNLTADVVREFETEVKIMSGLHHPNICMLLGACLAPASRALVIELVEHGSLWAVLRTRRRLLSDAMRSQFVVDTARGMRYLHQFELPILHRDMKSPNLLVERDFSIKISDFGLSRVKAQIQTMTGNCGTVQWMAPEVLGNCKYTEKADVFSFGIVVWEIFTGQCPYDGMTQIQVALGVLNHDLRPVIPRSCPRFFARLIQSCWAREPSLRPSFADLMHTFEQHVAYH
ncbi:unnamed protein product [Hyaloperonospora brassicae]|uniref:Protein kinase domain-containing protein n=1 Tax=Hyaloperonospora brassicae TaxID=162125 RepID=A0AAV0TT41_HYABA|nr:unnamed protein product [Hyaloperonospora brassicae]